VIYHKCEPRSAEWYYLRLGIPTASEFHRILTPGGKLSKQCEDYAYRLLAELMLGKPLDDSPETQWMIRGQELEDQAIDGYEFYRGCQTSPGGFCTNDAGTYGCSPDRLVGDDGVLEMKCPAPSTHVYYMAEPSRLDGEKRCQVQGQLLVTGRRWVDLVSYHPELPIIVRRIGRDAAYIASLAEALDSFVDVVRQMRQILEQQYGPFKPIVIPRSPEPAIVPDDFGVSDADIDAIWVARER